MLSSQHTIFVDDNLYDGGASIFNICPKPIIALWRLARMVKTVDQRISEYIKLCEEKKWPQFIPSSGICYNCHLQIFDRDDSYPTYCHHCNKSYCE